MAGPIVTLGKPDLIPFARLGVIGWAFTVRNHRMTTKPTTRRAALLGAVSASAAAALPSMANVANADVGPVFADPASCPALALYPKFQHCLNVVREAKELGDDAPEWTNLDRAEEAFMRAEARSAEAVYLKLWHYWDRGGPLNQFVLSGFTWDDRVRFSVLQ